MKGSLDGRVYLVTGGARGIGAASIRALLARGARVWCLDRTAPEGDHATDLITGFVEGDVSDPEQMTRAVDHVVEESGHLDGVVAAAGITRDAVCWKLTIEAWREVISVNLDGAYHLLRAAIPHMRENGRGTVVFVSSINGERGKFGQANYCASKAGVNALAKTAAAELGRYQIRVNAVAPGFIDTEMTRALPDSVRMRSIEATPLARIGAAAEVAAAIGFLCSDDASFITGQVLRVDGGQYT